MYNFNIEENINNFPEWMSNLSKKLKQIMKNILNFYPTGRIK